MGTLPGNSAFDHMFDGARRAAFIQDILAPLRNEPVDLLPFEEVRKTLQLRSQTYQGLQDVPGLPEARRRQLVRAVQRAPAGVHG